MSIVEFGGRIGSYFSRNNFFQFDADIYGHLEKFMKRCNYTDVYVCAYRYASDNIADCDIISDFYLDFDVEQKKDNKENSDEELYEEVKLQVLRILALLINTWKVNREAIEIYFSGHKGFHVVVPYECLGIVPCKNLNEIFKRVAMYFKTQFSAKSLDTGIYDRRRLFRVPNTINSKSGLYKVPLTITQLRDFSIYEIVEHASSMKPYPAQSIRISKESARFFREAVGNMPKAPRQKKKSLSLPKEHKPMLPCVNHMLHESIPKGSRNNTLVALASSIMQAGYSAGETEEILLEWNQGNEPPLPENELEKTVFSAWHMIQNGTGYGCQAFKEMGACIGYKCRLCRG